MDISLCLVATELFEWGHHGGIGMATRTIGAALVDRGVDVSVVVPQGAGQAPVEELDGMTVYGFPLWRYPLTGSLYRRIDADVYHSEGLSWGSIIAQDSMPDGRHIVTFQNPRTKEEWGALYRFYPLRRRIFNALYWGRLADAVGRMYAVYCQFRDLIPKVRARVRFVAMGRANDDSRDRALRRKFGGSGNLEMPGFISGERKHRVLEEAWVLVNTSVNEGFPVSFLEAAAHGCAVLSPHNPEGFASHFGCHVSDGDLDAGLRFLLDSDRWKRRGEEGYAYVSEYHEKGRVIDMHMEVYGGMKVA